ncbi:MAG: zinc-binding alcohol dehydrogenase [Candidatus Bathyarchaeota archaeon]|nr:zinc-binding alcohol dehydrogenase [Candidatus Bathyarchaeota archaeon]
MSKLSLFFEAPYKIAIRKDSIPSPNKGEVLVKSIVSSISPGTEMLVYRNQIPDDVPLDESIPRFNKPTRYPLKYGYSVVGEVVDIGKEVSSDWKKSIVFSFHPHESHFITSPDNLIPVPKDIQPEEASFLPNIETAINLLMDGKPIIGEKVIVFGQGIVGLLTTSLLSNFPLSCILTLDKYSLRREKSLDAGATESLDSMRISPEIIKDSCLKGKKSDLTYEVSGNPDALEYALILTDYSGRVIIGSWYGKKKSNLTLGGDFHRKRIRVMSSQVSTIDPRFLGRWNKLRRIQVAWDMIRIIKPSKFITNRFPLSEANKAYSMIDRSPDKTIQILFTY